MGSERVFTIYTSRKPDLRDGESLAIQLDLHPRPVMVMGRDCIEIFIPSAKFEAMIGSTGLNEGEQIVNQFIALGYGCEERQ